MRENPSRHQVFRVDTAITPATNDVFQSNGNPPKSLSREGDQKAKKSCDAQICENRSRADEKKGVEERKKPVAIMKKEVAYANHFTAMSPVKLYHLKNTSQYLNPQRRSISRFSINL